MPMLVRQTLCCLTVTASMLSGQQYPRTIPERTDYATTSTNAQVGAFLDSLQRPARRSPSSEMGVTALGKPLYLVIASEPTVTSAAEAAASGKLVVYLQANIHAGEVEGKEAVLVLLRELAGAAPRPAAEARDPRRARLQPRRQRRLRPAVGEPLRAERPRRSWASAPTGMNLDLNRDYFKAEAPETRASLAAGVRHLGPRGDGGSAHHRRHAARLPPDLRAAARADRSRGAHAVRARPDAPRDPQSTLAGPLPRADLRLRQRRGPARTRELGHLRAARLVRHELRGACAGASAILSEAYSHADFRTRIQVTHDFVVEILEYAASHADEIRRVERRRTARPRSRARGSRRGPPLAVAYRLAGARRGAGAAGGDAPQPRLGARWPARSLPDR